jgi:hypothetical protein
MPPQPVLPDP